MGRACCLTVLRCRPGYFVRPPYVCDLTIATDALGRHNELCDLGGWSIGWEPVFIQALLTDSWDVPMRRKQHTVIGEKSADASSISPEPSFLEHPMDALYLCNV